MKKLISLLCIIALMFSFAACTKDDNETPETPAPILINGNSIFEYSFLVDDNNQSGVLSLRNAIKDFCDYSLPSVKALPEDEKVIYVEVTPQQAPTSCRVLVEGNKLILRVFNKELIGKTVSNFKTLLTEGEQVVFEDGFKQTFNFEPVEMSKVSGKKLTLIGDANESPLSFKTGEKGTFYVAAFAENEIVKVPYFHLVIYYEGTKVKKDVYVDGSKGYCGSEITLDTPGFVYWDVVACDANKKAISGFNSQADGSNHFVGSAGFDVANIQGNTTLPSDFDSFWNGIAEGVRDMDLDVVKMEQVASGTLGYAAYVVELRCGTDINGNPGVATGYLTYPASASASNKIGLMVRFQGHSVAYADKNTADKTAVFTVCAHSMDQESARSDEDYLKSMKSALSGFENKGTTKEDRYFTGMIQRDLLAARFMVEYFGSKGNNFWDGTTFTAKGGSMGGFQSTVVAALAKTATGHALSHLDITIPWLCDVNGAGVGRKTSTFRPTSSTTLNYFDTVCFAHLIPSETVVDIYAGLGDHVCPASGVQAFFNALSCTEKHLKFEQNFSHAGGVGGFVYEE